MPILRAQPPRNDKMHWSEYANTVARDSFLVAHSKMTISQLQQALAAPGVMRNVGVPLSAQERDVMAYLVTYGYPNDDGLHRWKAAKHRSIIQSVATALGLDPDNTGKVLRTLERRGWLTIERTRHGESVTLSYQFHEFVAQVLWRRLILNTDHDLVIHMAQQVGWDDLMLRVDIAFKSSERDPSKKVDRLKILRLVRDSGHGIVPPDQG